MQGVDVLSRPVGFCCHMLMRRSDPDEQAVRKRTAKRITLRAPTGLHHACAGSCNRAPRRYDSAGEIMRPPGKHAHLRAVELQPAGGGGRGRRTAPGSLAWLRWCWRPRPTPPARPCRPKTGRPCAPGTPADTLCFYIQRWRPHRNESRGQCRDRQAPLFVTREQVP